MTLSKDKDRGLTGALTLKNLDIFVFMYCDFGWPLRTSKITYILQNFDTSPLRLKIMALS